jgi:hypothetical protein
MKKQTKTTPITTTAIIHLKDIRGKKSKIILSIVIHD